MKRTAPSKSRNGKIREREREREREEGRERTRNERNGNFTTTVRRPGETRNEEKIKRNDKKR